MWILLNLLNLNKLNTMKTINLFFDMEFTSLSPDAQIISLGIAKLNIQGIQLGWVNNKLK